MKRLLLFFISAFIIFSCGSKESVQEKKAREEKEHEEIKEKAKQKTISELTAKYNIGYNLDTFESRFSIDFKPILESKYLLIDWHGINDIFQKDSSFFVSINLYGAIRELVFPVSKEQILAFSNRDLVNLLVVHIDEIKKIKFVFEGETEGEDVSVSLENSSGFSAKGKLIEIVSLKE